MKTVAAPLIAHIVEREPSVGGIDRGRRFFGAVLNKNQILSPNMDMAGVFYTGPENKRRTAFGGLE